jgi:hypothetical protein
MEFHGYEVVMRALPPLVPPQLAIRQIEADRARQHYNREPNEPAPPWTVPRETDHAIAVGGHRAQGVELTRPHRDLGWGLVSVRTIKRSSARGALAGGQTAGVCLTDRVK